MNKRYIEKRKMRRECYSLDFAFLKWLQPHLKQYLKDADRIVNLDFHTFEYNGKTFTQKQIINIMIRDLSLILDSKKLSNMDEEYEKLVDEVLDLWRLVFYHMWW